MLKCFLHLTVNEYEYTINNIYISRTGTTETAMKKYDLMNQVNARGTFLWYFLNDFFVKII